VPNRLANEVSPYLQQHKDNPVDWYPWGTEALERARAEDKPMLVSIGYSACHWCHVMAHESFDDPATAELMNEHFINIKVDREERPDIDSLYMTAVQAMTGQGGWPLNVFTTPEGVPFYGGTYWPPEDRMGMPAFRRVLDAVADTWANKREQIIEQGDQIRAALAHRPSGSVDGGDVEIESIERAIQRLGGQYDPLNGGFGGAPKFPQAPVLSFLLHAHHLLDDRGPLTMAVETLEKMARGGIYDQVGGGFHRYAVDNVWLVPHFEKMLYDNAQLSQIYLDGYRISGQELFRRVAEQTLDYVLREMTSEQGGFYAAQDADSEGEEGKFYVWTPDEIRAVLAPDDAELAQRYFGIAEGGNFEGKSILTLAGDPGEYTEDIKRIRDELYAARAKRIWPHRDEKIITSWNGMTIRALAEGGLVLGRQDFIDTAAKCAGFLKRDVDVDGVLHRSYGGGSARIPAFLEDYAQLIDGLMRLYEATLDLEWLTWAQDLTERMVNLFADEEEGGFYDTSRQHDQLAIRPRELQDGATPCGSSVAADILIRMGHLTSNDDMIERGNAVLRSMRDFMEDQPLGFGRYLTAACRILGTVREVSIASPPDDQGIRPFQEAVYRRYEPNAIIGLVSDEAIAVMPWLADRPVRNGQPTAYLCEQFVCLPPVTVPADLTMQLEMGTGMSWQAF
jgi:uncharacterized protein YyaL (SSP411 family)